MECTETAVVLLVGEDQESIDLYATWLAETYTVTTATGKTTARDHLDDTIDIVLLDRSTPELTGDAIRTMIRERDLDCRLAILADADPDGDVFARGFDAYLQKNVTPAELQELVDALYRRLQYETQLQEYVTRHLNHETSEGQSDSAASESCSRDTNEDSRLAELEQSLQTVQNEFTETDYRALFHRIC